MAPNANFTAENVLKYIHSQYGIVGGQKYWDYWRSQNLGSYCCVGLCTAYAECGYNIGLWTNCGTSEASRGIQAGFKKAGFTRVSSMKEAVKGAALIIDHKDDEVYIYDHVCTWEGDYNAAGTKARTANFNVSGTNGERFFPLDHIREIWNPPFADGKTGWVKENGAWHHYTNGTLDTRMWREGDGNYKGKYYYLGGDGTPLKSQWLLYNGEYYYLGSEGHALSDTFVEGTGYYAGRWFYLGSKGTPLKNQIITHDGKVYYLGADGAAVVNQAVKGKDGKYYWFGADGALLKGATVTFSTDANGAMSFAGTEE